MRLKRTKTFLFFTVATSAGCVTVPPPYQQTYHDPSMPKLDLIYVGNKDWVDGFAELYKDNPEADKFFAVYGDITVLKELPKESVDDDNP